MYQLSRVSHKMDRWKQEGLRIRSRIDPDSNIIIRLKFLKYTNLLQFKIIKIIEIGYGTLPTTIFNIVLVKCSILILRIRIQTCWKGWIRIRVKVMRRFETLADGLKKLFGTVPDLLPLTLYVCAFTLSNLKNQLTKEIRSAHRRF